MVKRIFLASLFLLMPLFANGEILVIGSENSLKEKNLPLVYELLDTAYREELVTEGCLRKQEHSMLEPFLDGSIDVPFSAQDLLNVCKKYILGYTMYNTGRPGILPVETKKCKNVYCPRYVLRYIEELAKMPKKSLRFDADVLKRVIESCKIKYGEDTCEIDFRNIRDAIAEGSLKENFAPEQLYSACKNKYFPTRGNLDSCSEMVVEYKSIIEEENK